MDNVIIVEKEDVKKLLYFIVSMFQQENTHRQGTSSKSDYIGGYIDRWINRIPEDLIFSKGLLVDKEYSVINDYFIYGAQSEKNAPDVLGIQTENGIIKFAEFNESRWVQVEGMPHIEIKTFRKNQKLVSVRDTQLDDDNYYMFIETDLLPDYLIKVFQDEFLSEDISRSILMDEFFIVNNSRNILIQPPEIQVDASQSLGTIKIINVIKGNDYRSRSTLCEQHEDVLYLKNVVEASRVTGRLSEPVKFTDLFAYQNNISMYKGILNGKKVINMYANNVDNLNILKINNKSVYCQANEDCSIYNYQLERNKIYKVEFEVFERSSQWTEFVALKNQFTDNLDKTEELVGLLDNIANSNYRE